MTEMDHLLGLHMHQPPGNLRFLLETNEWEARQIMLCYERPLRYASRYADVARFCVGFSGTLLDQFLDPDIVSRYASIVDIPRMLEGYRNASNIELVGMGYYHPVFPLIPEADWDEHLKRSSEKYLEVFGRTPKIFWPPEMAFCMGMIPHLASHGYGYVIVDGVHVKPKEMLSEADLMYSVHTAEYEKARITVIPRDRGISNAQESGLEPSWFENEVRNKTASAKKPCLVTTWSDGENGGWFRQTQEASGFWGHFFAPYMERVRSGSTIVRPASLSDVISKHPPVSQVDVETGAWNIGRTDGYDFSQWAGSPAQKEALEELWAVSKAYHEVASRLSEIQRQGVNQKLNEALTCLLNAETSCYLFWGDAWIPKLYEQTQQTRQLLAEAQRMSAEPA